MADAIITPEFTPCEGCDEPEACEIVSRCLEPQLDMRAEFEAWVRDRGCDTDGAWSAWQACWNLLTAGVQEETVAEVWRYVEFSGLPHCDGETVFVGINAAGFSCCFNEVTQDGVCSMHGPELSTVQMSALRWWRVLDRPAVLGMRPVKEQSAREVMQMALDALEAAHAGLEWYRDRCPNEVNGSDDEADEQIGAAMGALVGALGAKEDQRG